MIRKALVTGGSRGIGLGICRELARSGFRLVVNGVRPGSEVGEALEELRDIGTGVSYIAADISNAKDREKLFREAVADGPVHVLVNNAGVAPLERRDILEATEESFDRLMRINLKGPYFLTQRFARHMVEQKKADPAFEGCIIFVTSVSSTLASVNRGEYCISKAGLTMASRLWAVRLGEYDIPVYEIRPGVTRTDMTEKVRESYDRMIGEGLCLQRRWGTPGDMGKVAAAMATGSIPYATGQAVVVDGGLTVPRL